jgi:hypothetical protein
MGEILNYGVSRLPGTKGNLGRFCWGFGGDAGIEGKSGVVFCGGLLTGIPGES